MNKQKKKTDMTMISDYAFAVGIAIAGIVYMASDVHTKHGILIFITTVILYTLDQRP